jgi:hypothetical protein
MSIKTHRIRDGAKCKNSTHFRRQRRIRSQWSVRRFRAGSPEGPASVEFTFPTEGGGTSRILIPHRELRHDRALMDLLADRLPIFPSKVGTTDKSRLHFIRDLVSSYNGPFELIPDRTGFIGLDGFATYTEIIYADGRKQPIPQSHPLERLVFTDVRGTREGTKQILKLARRSTYLAFGFGVALACPLPSYLKLHPKRANEETAHLTETGVFNFSGRSSSGKSSVILAAMSLAGSPDRAGTLDVTPRGLAEMASDSNDMLLGLDDTEKAEDGAGVLVSTLKKLVHTVPGGRSKRISRGVDQSRFPLLHWSTFGLCSSPKPISKLAMENGWEMTRGDKVRLFDIPVPSSNKGGIFDLISGTPTERAKRSVKLIAELERGYQNHHGHVISDWARYLMAKDRSKQVLQLVNEFIEYVGGKRDGWETRFAQKFGYIYAAMVMGIKAGLLPWPDSFPLQVVSHCYRKARRSAKTAKERALEATAKLHRLVLNEDRVVDAPSAKGHNTAIKITKRCIAIRYRKNGRRKFGVLDDALLKLLGSPKAKAAFMKFIATAGLVRGGHGHAGTIQERFKNKRDGKLHDSVRVWCVDAKRLLRFLKEKEINLQTVR